MLHITYNYALQTIQALSLQGYTASMVPPTTACSASRVCSMSASRGYFPGSTIRTFIGILLIRSFFQRIFLLNGQQHDPCRRCKGHDHNSQQRETISCLREGLHLMRRRRRCRRRGCSGRRLRCGNRRGRGGWLRLSSELTACRRVSIRHPHFRGRTEKSRHQRFPT